MFHLDPDGFQSGRHWNAGLVIFRHAGGRAHAYLHVPQIWNRHNSHFGDVTPTESTERKKVHVYHAVLQRHTSSFWRESYNIM